MAPGGWASSPDLQACACGGSPGSCHPPSALRLSRLPCLRLGFLCCPQRISSLYAAGQVRGQVWCLQLPQEGSKRIPSVRNDQPTGKVVVTRGLTAHKGQRHATVYLSLCHSPPVCPRCCLCFLDCPRPPSLCSHCRPHSCLLHPGYLLGQLVVQEPQNPNEGSSHISFNWKWLWDRPREASGKGVFPGQEAVPRWPHAGAQ